MRKHNRLRKACTAALAVIALIFSALMVAQPAQAVTCYGDYCSGLLPEQTGCDADAYTATVNNYATGSLQVRYSPTCKTNWARIVVYATGVGCAAYGDLYAVQDTGYQQWANVPATCNTYSSTTYWTPMIYSPVHLVRGVFYNFGRSWDTVVTPWA